MWEFCIWEWHAKWKYVNAKHTENNKKWLTFWSNFFNLLTHWLGGKLESLPSLLRVYKVYSESTKKRIYSRVNSQRINRLVNL